MNSPATDLNGRDYWSQRFREDWETRGGRHQSRAFSSLALQNMPQWLVSAVRMNRLSVLDWGCALGDGTDVLASALRTDVTGIDFAEPAIEDARKVYKSCEFLCEDLCSSPLSRTWDMIFSSNTLEHFSNPWSVAERLAGHARCALTIMVPYREMDRYSEHEYTFVPDNIPVVIGSLHVAHFALFDASSEPAAMWNGRQMLLVYISADFARTLSITLGDVSISSAALEAARASHEAAVQAFDHERTELKRALGSVKSELSDAQAATAAREAELSTLRDVLQATQEQLSAGDRQRDELMSETAAREAELSTLRDALQAAREQFAAVERQRNHLEYLVGAMRRSASWRVTAPVRKVGQVGRAASGVWARNAKRARFLLQRCAEDGVVGTLVWVRRRLTLSAPGLGEGLNISLHQHTDRHRTAFITSAFQFEELSNQRPIHLAKYLASTGTHVVFVVWQWAREESLSKSGSVVHPGVLQLSLYDFLDSIDRLPLSEDYDKTLFLTFPAPILLEAARRLRYRGARIIYDIMDEWEEFTKVGQAPWFSLEVEERVVLEADAVSAVSSPLLAKFSHLRSDIILSPNGYCESVLGDTSWNIASKWKDGDDIVVGYFGHLTNSWFDWDRVFQVAQDNSDISLEIIGYGAPEEATRLLKEYQNIKYIGPVKPQDLHNFARRWNVGLIPFKCGPLAEAVDPIKIYEYVYMGLPTVVSGIRHIGRYPMTRVVEPEDSMADAIRVQAKLETSTIRSNIDMFLSESTWGARFEALGRRINTVKTVGDLYA